MTDPLGCDRMELPVKEKAHLRTQCALEALEQASKAPNHFCFYNHVQNALMHLSLAVQEQDVTDEDLYDYPEEARRLVAALRKR